MLELVGGACGSLLAIYGVGRGVVRAARWGGAVLSQLASIDRRFAAEARAREQDRKQLRNHEERLVALEEARV